MYLPAHFAETRPEVLHRLIADHPFGTLVSAGDGGLDAEHIPFELDPGAGELGTLRAHVARANPVWTGAREHAEVLVVFRAADAYVDTEAVRLTAQQALWRLAVGLPASEEVASAKWYARSPTYWSSVSANNCSVISPTVRCSATRSRARSSP